MTLTLPSGRTIECSFFDKVLFIQDSSFPLAILQGPVTPVQQKRYQVCVSKGDRSINFTSGSIEEAEDVVITLIEFIRNCHA